MPTKRNYHQAKRQKEQSRKARQDKKQQRRLGRTEEAGSGASEPLPGEPLQPGNPDGTPSS